MYHLVATTYVWNHIENLNIMLKKTPIINSEEKISSDKILE